MTPRCFLLPYRPSLARKKDDRPSLFGGQARSYGLSSLKNDEEEQGLPHWDFGPLHARSTERSVRWGDGLLMSLATHTVHRKDDEAYAEVKYSTSTIRPLLATCCRSTLERALDPSRVFI